MKVFVNISLLIVSMFILGACSLEQKKIEDLQVENLAGSLLQVDSFSIGARPRLQMDRIWLLKSTSNNVNATVCIQRGDSLITKCQAFYRGNGRGEFDNIAFSKGQNKSLYVLNYPSTGNKLLSLTVIPEKKYAAFDFKGNEVYDLRNIPSVRFLNDSFSVLSDSTMLIAGAPYNQIGHIFTVVNFKKETWRTLDFWPSDTHDKIDSLAKHSVYTDNCKIFNSGNKFLYQCGWERYAFIFTISGNKIVIENELFSTKLDYKEIADGNYVPLKNSGKTLKMATNDNAIYSLMIEKNAQGGKPNNYMESHYGNEIQVYQWDGTPLRRILLDKVGWNIMVSADNKKMYLFSINPQTNADEIWEYNL